MVPDPPAALSRPNITLLRRGAALFRIHRTEYGPAAFNPCRGASTRFAPITDATGSCIPSLYAATSAEAAAFETVFQEVLPGPFASLSDHELRDRNAATLRLVRDLSIAQLHAPDLRPWGLHPSDLPAAPSRFYAQTARWAEAIHRQFDTVDGLVWTSNACDPDRCYIFFGDRVSEQDFHCLAQSNLGAPGPARSGLVEAARRAGITIVLS